jgi:hypothetical protein
MPTIWQKRFLPASGRLLFIDGGLRSVKMNYFMAILFSGLGSGKKTDLLLTITSTDGAPSLYIIFRRTGSHRTKDAKFNGLLPLRLRVHVD